MANLNFDTNRWHRVFVVTDPDRSMKGTSLYDDGNTGAVFMESTDLTKAGHNWQIVRVDDDRHIFRSRDSVNGLLAARYWDREDTPGNTVPYIQKNATDESMFWRIGNWNDGSFYLTNDSNGTEWHMARITTGLVMTSNITAPQPKQQWSFSALSAIDDTRFSTIVTPSTTIVLGETPTASQSIASITSQSTATLTSIPTSTSSPLPGPADDSTRSKGLSAGAIAGIGAAAGAVAVLSIVGLILFFLRRRRRAQQTPPDYPPKYEYYKHETPEPQELGDGPGNVKYEMEQPPVISELPAGDTTPKTPTPALHPIIYTTQH